MTDAHKPPFSEILQAIPGFFGIRLEEEPAYKVLERFGEVEIRRYAPLVLAQVTVQGTHDQAMDAAFDKLAGYLYGGNRSGQQLPMTSPVSSAAMLGQHACCDPVLQAVGSFGSSCPVR